jgi:hypothetical protein
MEASKAYMKKNGFGDRISFSDLSAHTVKLIDEKEDSIPDTRGGTIAGMKYLVEENGEKKTIFTGSIGLITKLAQCNKGDTVTIKMSKANNKSFYVVKRGDEEIGVKEVSEDMPTIYPGDAPDTAMNPEEISW